MNLYLLSLAQERWKYCAKYTVSRTARLKEWH